MHKNLLLLAFLFSVYTYAQVSPCGFEEFRTSGYKNNTLLKEKEQQANAILYRHAANRGPRAVLDIPVVVHVIHQGGNENLSDSLIVAAINNLNLRYQNAAPFTDATGNDMEVHFCLATVNPQGNPTNGITRTFSSYTALNANDDVLMKNMDRWDPLYYLNIWTVDYIFGFNISVAGYATMPSNIGDASDGVVTAAGSLNSSVLAHEVGHYLGLYHTWNTPNGIANCLNDNCLLDGDMVCDTPPDTSIALSGCMLNSCSSEMDDTSGFNPFTGDVNELPNYMDYNLCPISFSAGQGSRMHDVVNNIRFLLLESVACGFTGGPLPVAQLSYTVSPCNNGVVSFSDSLSTLSNMVNWDFNNDGVYDSYVHNPTYTYPATGNYVVKLLVVGPGGVDSVFQSVFVQKAPSLYYPIVTYNGIFTANNAFSSCGNYTVTCSAAPAQSYLWSTGDTTQTISFTPSTSFTLTLTTVDSLGLTWTNALCHPMVVDVQPLPPVPVIYSNDPLTICDGDQVTFHSIVNGTGPYTYQWYQNGSNPANSTDSIFTATGYFPGISYQLIISDTNQCYNYSNYLYVNSYNAPAQQSLTQNGSELSTLWGDGVQWYLDGVAIIGANTSSYTVTQAGCYRVEWFFSFAPACRTMSADSICFLTVGNVDASASNDFKIYPVPANNYIQLNLSTQLIGATYRLLEPTGRVVASEKINEASTRVDIKALADGLYFIELIKDGKRMVQKVIKE